MEFKIKDTLKSLGNIFAGSVFVFNREKILYSSNDKILNTSLDSHPIVKKMLQSEMPQIITTPGAHLLCSYCAASSNCSVKLEVAFPFFTHGKAVNGGVCYRIGRDAFLNENDLNDWLALLKYFTDFLHYLLEEKEQLLNEYLLKQQLSYLINLVPEAVAVIDGQGRIQGLNSHAQKVNMENCLGKNNVINEIKKAHGSKGQFRITVIERQKPLELNTKTFGDTKKFAGAIVHTIEKSKDLNDTFPQKRNLLAFNKIIGSSSKLKKAMEIAEQVASSDSTVLLRGESGTGKEMFALEIHLLSPRRNENFITINCAAIPDNLLESELFGYEEGAFTGAKKGGKKGKFELANNGTLFLDEIGDMPPALQAKLLRVLQEKKIERVGSTKSIPINTRIIAATHRNLEEMIAEGTFREDLFFRLNVIPIFIPPLRERPEDIKFLLNYYLKKYCILLKKDFKVFSQEALEILMNYHWPGNIRELENTVEYLVNVESADEIVPASLPGYIRFNQDANKENDRKTSLSTHKKKRLIAALEKHGYDTEGKKRAARELKISLSTLYRWAKKYNVEI
ncbi:MAG: sigma-54 dependent transcriptional regulator, acetoin dehydrogenase operon transcriptional [Thermosediminibacterales bacterium]|nr:sigma-54 dependent transcriptional regulator, acetoin dehydrogenase operon transcriptional [Thermosediminibacterales bacterium]MDK2836219.1 sigma-54 dependent transcriptional regulator, acetoin dehydrogenase operon transcriptional [Thermosediminibacterales bacterium]